MNPEGYIFLGSKDPKGSGRPAVAKLGVEAVFLFFFAKTMEDNSEQLEKLVQKFVLASGPGNRPTHEAGVEELQRMAALRYVARCYILALLFIQSNWITSE